MPERQRTEQLTTHAKGACNERRCTEGSKDATENIAHRQTAGWKNRFNSRRDRLEWNESEVGYTTARDGLTNEHDEARDTEKLLSAAKECRDARSSMGKRMTEEYAKGSASKQRIVGKTADTTMTIEYRGERGQEIQTSAEGH